MRRVHLDALILVLVTTSKEEVEQEEQEQEQEEMRLLSWLAWCGAVAAVDSVVDLGYAKYQGRIVGDGTTQWLGMRYAQAPLGKLRFRAPVEPGVVKGVQDASKVNTPYSSECFQPSSCGGGEGGMLTLCSVWKHLSGAEPG